MGRWCLLLVVKSATAAPVARCEESWIASASLLVVSFPFRGKDIIELLNVWPKCLGIMNAVMNLQSVKDRVEKAIESCALILAWVVWLSWWSSVEKIPLLCLQYVVSTADHFHSAVRKGMRVDGSSSDKSPQALSFDMYLSFVVNTADCGLIYTQCSKDLSL